MKSLKRNFERVVMLHPDWTTYTCFAEAIYKRGFGKQVIRRWFYKMVQEDDYVKSETKEIFSSLDLLTKVPEDDKK